MSGVAIIILTFNEEENLGAALDSVRGWADEVFVVDSYSTDRTVDIALGRAADHVRVVQHRFDHYSAQWNWALHNLPIRSPWTLKLDADERVTPDFRAELRAELSSAPGAVAGFYFRRRLIFMGAPVCWGGFSDTYVLHLWRTGRALFEDRAVNEHALVDGGTRKLRASLDHHDTKSLTHWIDKHNRYASLEARSILRGNVTGAVRPRLLGTPDERRMWQRRAHSHVPGRAGLYFLYRYLLRLGLLDGAVGFRLALLHAMYLYWIDLKLGEARRTGRTPEILWPPRGAPHPIVAASALQALVAAGGTGSAQPASEPSADLPSS